MSFNSDNRGGYKPRSSTDAPYQDNRQSWSSSQQRKDWNSNDRQYGYQRDYSKERSPSPKRRKSGNNDFDSSLDRRRPNSPGREGNSMDDSQADRRYRSEERQSGGSSSSQYYSGASSNSNNNTGRGGFGNSNSSSSGNSSLPMNNSSSSSRSSNQDYNSYRGSSHSGSSSAPPMADSSHSSGSRSGDPYTQQQRPMVMSGSDSYRRGGGDMRQQHSPQQQSQQDGSTMRQNFGYPSNNLSNSSGGNSNDMKPSSGPTSNYQDSNISTSPNSRYSRGGQSNSGNSSSSGSSSYPSGDGTPYRSNPRPPIYQNSPSGGSGSLSSSNNNLSGGNYLDHDSPRSFNSGGGHPSSMNSGSSNEGSRDPLINKSQQRDSPGSGGNYSNNQSTSSYSNSRYDNYNSSSSGRDRYGYSNDSMTRSGGESSSSRMNSYESNSFQHNSNNQRSSSSHQQHSSNYSDGSGGRPPLDQRESGGRHTSFNSSRGLSMSSNMRSHNQDQYSSSNNRRPYDNYGEPSRGSSTGSSYQNSSSSYNNYSSSSNYNSNNYSSNSNSTNNPNSVDLNSSSQSNMSISAISTMANASTGVPSDQLDMSSQLSNQQQSLQQQNQPSLGSSMDSVSSSNASSSNPLLTQPPPQFTPVDPAMKIKLLTQIEEKEDQVVEVTKQIENLKKEREKLSKEVAAPANSKHPGKDITLVPGVPITPEILTMDSEDLVELTYHHNQKLAKRSDQVVLAQLWENGALLKDRYKPFIKFLTSTSRQFAYQAIAERNILAAATSASLSSNQMDIDNNNTNTTSLNDDLNTSQLSSLAASSASFSNQQSSKSDQLVDSKMDSSSFSPRANEQDRNDPLRKDESAMDADETSKEKSAAKSLSGPPINETSKSGNGTSGIDSNEDDNNKMDLSSSEPSTQVKMEVENSALSSSSGPTSTNSNFFTPPKSNTPSPPSVSDSSSSLNVKPDPNFLPEIEGDCVVDDTHLFDEVDCPEPSVFNFYEENQKFHETMRDSMVQWMISHHKTIQEKTIKMAKQHRKATKKWLRRLQLDREEEATRKLLQNKKWLALAQSGRKFTVRASTKPQDNDKSAFGSGKKKVQSSNGGLDEEEEEYDEQRYETTKAVVPPMHEFDSHYDEKVYQFVDNNGFVEDSRFIDQEIKVDRYWHPDEEDLFVRAFLRYHKNFVKISQYLPGKQLKEVIWFYYTRKNKLDLKRRFQREGYSQLQQLGVGISGLTQTSDPAASSLIHYMGSNLEWVNGASRRGSLRLLEKGTQKTGQKGVNDDPGDVDISSTSGISNSTPSAFNSISSNININSSNYTSGSGNSSSTKEFDSTLSSPGRNSNNSNAIFANNNKDNNLLNSPASSAYSSPLETANRWTPEERDRFKAAFDIHGKEFKAIADIMKTKNAAQCKNYYHNNKKKLQLPSASATASPSAASQIKTSGEIPSSPSSPYPGQFKSESDKPKDSERKMSISEYPPSTSSSTATTPAPTSAITTSSSNNPTWMDISDENKSHGNEQTSSDPNPVKQEKSSHSDNNSDKYDDDHHNDDTKMDIDSDQTKGNQTELKEIKSESLPSSSNPTNNSSNSGNTNNNLGNSDISQLDTASPSAVVSASKKSFPRAGSSHWSDEEKQQFKELLAVHGKDWKVIAMHIATKNLNQIKNFFQNYRIKLKLDDLLPESDRVAASGSTSTSAPASTSTTPAPTTARASKNSSKKKKATKRGRPKKTGEKTEIEDNYDLVGDDDEFSGNESIEEGSAKAGTVEEDSGTESALSEAEPSSTSSVASNSIGSSEIIPTTAAKNSGKRKRSETSLDAVSELPEEEDDQNTTNAVAVNSSSPVPSLKGKGKSARGGKGAKNSSGPPPIKKRKGEKDTSNIITTSVNSAISDTPTPEASTPSDNLPPNDEAQMSGIQVSKASNSDQSKTNEIVVGNIVEGEQNSKSDSIANGMETGESKMQVETPALPDEHKEANLAAASSN